MGFKSWKSRAAAIAVTATMTVPMLGLTSSAGAAGNAANAKACQQGGWQSLQTDAGGTFKNQGDCASYGAKGGALFAPKLTFSRNPVESFSSFDVLGSGFHSNSAGTFSLAVHGQPPYELDPETTTATGTLDVVVASGDCANSGDYDASFTDASGVTATATFTQLPCS